MSWLLKNYKLELTDTFKPGSKEFVIEDVVLNAPYNAVILINTTGAKNVFISLHGGEYTELSGSGSYETPFQNGEISFKFVMDENALIKEIKILVRSLGRLFDYEDPVQLGGFDETEWLEPGDPELPEAFQGLHISKNQITENQAFDIMSIGNFVGNRLDISFSSEETPATTYMKMRKISKKNNVTGSVSNKFLYSGDGEGNLHKLDYSDMSTISVLDRFRSFSTGIRAIVNDKNGFIYVSEYVGPVRKINESDMSVVGTYFVPEEYSYVPIMVFSEKENCLYAVNYSPCYIYKIDASSMNNEGVVYIPEEYPYGLVVDQAGRLYAGFSEYHDGWEAKIVQIDTATGNVLATFSNADGAALGCMTIDNYGYIYYGDSKGFVHKVDTTDMSLVGTYTGHGGGAIHSLSIGPDGYLYSGEGQWGVGPTVHKIDMATMSQAGVYLGHNASVLQVAAGSDGYIYSSDEKGEVHKIDSSDMSQVEVRIFGTRKIESLLMTFNIEEPEEPTDGPGTFERAWVAISADLIEGFKTNPGDGGDYTKFHFILCKTGTDTFGNPGFGGIAYNIANCAKILSGELPASNSGWNTLVDVYNGENALFIQAWPLNEGVFTQAGINSLAQRVGIVPFFATDEIEYVVLAVSKGKSPAIIEYDESNWGDMFKPQENFYDYTSDDTIDPNFFRDISSDYPYADWSNATDDPWADDPRDFVRVEEGTGEFIIETPGGLAPYRAVIQIGGGNGATFGNANLTVSSDLFDGFDNENGVYFSSLDLVLLKGTPINTTPGTGGSYNGISINLVEAAKAQTGERNLPPNAYISEGDNLVIKSLVNDGLFEEGTIINRKIGDGVNGDDTIDSIFIVAQGGPIKR